MSGLVLALTCYAPLSDFLKSYISLNEIWANPVAFIFILMIVTNTIYEDKEGNLSDLAPPVEKEISEIKPKR